MTNKSGITFYIYRMILYEEITKEFLIHNQPFIKEEAEKNDDDDNNIKEEVKKKLAEDQVRIKRLNKSFNYSHTNIPKRRFSEPLKNILVSEYKDSSDNANTAIFNEPNENNLKQLIEETTKYYVPIAICIKTKNLINNSYEKLLIALARILCTEVNKYSCELHNQIYTYSEFFSHIIFLTHMISPPPATNYILQLGLTEVIFSEGPISTLPCEGDACVAQLFSILNDDFILTIFKALLLDLRVILCSKEVNSCFFIIKALTQLMFPFRWQFSKGIAPHLSLLTQPHPYFYGLINVEVKEREVIIKRLRREQFSFILVDVETLELDMNIEKDVAELPFKEELSTHLFELRARYNLSNAGMIKVVTQYHVDFSKAVRMKFLKMMNTYSKNARKVFKEIKEDDFILFSERYLSLFEKENTDEVEVNFMKQLQGSQCFATLYDEISMEMQENYARFEAITKSKENTQTDYMQMYINSYESITISRIAKLAKTAIEEKIPSNGINWSKEIFTMKDNNKKHLNSFGSEEQKSTRIQESDMNFYDNPLLRKKRKEPLFYGYTGLLSFCQEIFSLPGNTKNTLNIFEDINTLLKKFCDAKLEVNFYNRRTIGSITQKKLNDTPVTSISESKFFIIYIESSIGLHTNLEETFMRFSNSATCQFFLLCAIYYCKYQPQPAQIVNVTSNKTFSGTWTHISK